MAFAFILIDPSPPVNRLIFSIMATLFPEVDCDFCWISNDSKLEVGLIPVRF